MDIGFPEKSACLLIGLYSPTFIQQGKNFYIYVLVGYFILIIKMCVKSVYRMGGSQRLPPIMHVWERTRNFIIIKRIRGFKG